MILSKVNDLKHPSKISLWFKSHKIYSLLAVFYLAILLLVAVKVTGDRVSYQGDAASTPTQTISGTLTVWIEDDFKNNTSKTNYSITSIVDGKYEAFEELVLLPMIYST